MMSGDLIARDTPLNRNGNTIVPINVNMTFRKINKDVVIIYIYIYILEFTMIDTYC